MYVVKSPTETTQNEILISNLLRKTSRDTLLKLRFLPFQLLLHGYKNLKDGRNVVFWNQLQGTVYYRSVMM
jgi:hypothetical protein